jgi:hypothetical protein
MSGPNKDFKPLIKKKKNWVPVAHTCNLGYSGGRDQEDCGSKPAQNKKGCQSDSSDRVPA